MRAGSRAGGLWVLLFDAGAGRRMPSGFVRVKWFATSAATWTATEGGTTSAEPGRLARLR